MKISQVYKYAKTRLLSGSIKYGNSNLNRKNRNSFISYSSNATYLVCDNINSVEYASKRLRSSPYVLFDSEGHGKSMNTLSLIQLGNPDADEVFLFDMFRLNNKSQALRHLLGFLSDPKIIKVGWGGKTDYMKLKTIYRTTMVSFLDLQIVDIRRRLHEGETRSRQIKRLSSPSFPETAINSLEIEDVHALSSMDAALIEHQIIDVPRKEGMSSCAFILYYPLPCFIYLY